MSENKTTKFSKYFDHTILSPVTTPEALKAVCDEAIKNDFCSVAVNTGMVKQCAEFLRGSSVLVDAAVGFPLGITTIENKLHEAEEAIANGAGEVDYVVHIGMVKCGDFAYIKKEMTEMVSLCQRAGVTSKVIFENCYLTDDEKKKLCEIAREVKPDFIKTSTGFGKSGATVEDVALMKKTVGDEVAVKAAGGIRNLEICRQMIAAGADRIGCSASVEILNDYNEENN